VPDRPDSRYIPALDYDWLTPAYDTLSRLTMPERAFKERLIEQAQLRSGHVVLDLGCGTATLAIMTKRAQPEATVLGLDGDPKILAIAARKVAQAGVGVGLQHGMAFDLPYPDASLDRVLSSLVFHHLTSEDKRRALAECYRVLRPAGELHMADWGRPHNVVMWLASWSVRLFDGLHTTADNVQGRLPALCRQAGFVGVEETGRFATVFGTLSLYGAQKRPHTVQDHPPW
jgi:ubiquinone/menaquinone biosynthesis C-methylase UbiE